MTVSLGPNQSEAFVSHQGEDGQQAIVYLDLELQGVARISDTVMNVIRIDVKLKPGAANMRLL